MKNVKSNGEEGERTKRRAGDGLDESNLEIVENVSINELEMKVVLMNYKKPR